MPRPKPPAPPVQFATKLPPDVHAAVGLLVPHWHAATVAALAAQGIHTPPHADRTAWLISKIREDAARYGIAIPSSLPPPAAKPRRSRAKAAAPVASRWRAKGPNGETVGDYIGPEAEANARASARNLGADWTAEPAPPAGPSAAPSATHYPGRPHVIVLGRSPQEQEAMAVIEAAAQKLKPTAEPAAAEAPAP